MKPKSVIFAAVFALVLLPLFAGFAGSDAVHGRWDRLSRSGTRLLGSAFFLRPAAAQDDETPATAYREALDIVKNQYYGDKVDTKKTRELTYAAIRGMLFTLNDPFTSFLDPDEWQRMQVTTRGDFEGIGAVLEPFGQDVRVVRPIPDSPAYRAGVKAGDVILIVGTHDEKTGRLVKNTPTLGKTIDDVVKMIKGPSGTKVTITVSRKAVNKPITFTLTRARIEPPIVQYWMEDTKNKIGRIVLNEFNEKSDQQFDKALSDLEKQGLKALVFDLRYNPGGLLNVAVDIGSRFISRGPVVIIQEKSGQRQELRVRRQQHNHPIYPMVVLVNENSASASEIVAGAIKDNATGTLVGEHTFGKGLVQTLLPLTDGSALRLTTARYFTSGGNDISNKYDDEHRPIPNTGGVKPDVVVKQSEKWTDMNFEDKTNDTQLHKALDILRQRLASNTRAGR